jgi:hypothetical protein
MVATKLATSHTAKRFSRVPGMFNSSEVEVFHPT